LDLSSFILLHFTFNIKTVYMCGLQEVKGIVKWQGRGDVSGVNQTVVTSHTIADVFYTHLNS
jgi:hypothetical protein